MKNTIVTSSGNTNLLNRNINFLRQYQPDIVNELLYSYEHANSSSNPVSVIQAKTGKPSLKHADILLHSMYDPEKEARRFVEGLSLHEHINVVFLGLGMGYHIEEVVRQSAKRNFILIVEKELSIFRAFIETRDLADFYNQCRIYFAVGKSPMEIFRALQGCSLDIFANGITVIQHPSSVKIDPAYYNTVGEKIKDIFQWARVNTISQIKAAQDYARNIFDNMPAYLTLPGIKKLFNKFIGFPGIVVSAGPSLIKNIKYLKEAQGRVIIISVDTALRVLLNHGIEPDFVVSIDYTKHNARYFEGIPQIDTALVIDPEVYPDIISRYQGPKFMISLPGKSLCDWLESAVGDKGGMDKGLSVAHTAFLLAVRLGLAPIGFVGQDLSFPGNMTHVRGSAMVRKSRVNSSQKDTTYVMDIFGGKVLTTTAMQVFLRHFEDLFDNHNVECYDLTEGGAFICGTKPMPLKEFILCKAGKQMNIKNILKQAYGEKGSYDSIKLHSALTKAVNGLKHVKKICEKGKQVIAELKTRVNTATRDFSKITKLLSEWSQISKHLHSQRDVFILLGNNITDVMVLQMKKDTFDIDSLDKTNIAGITELLDKDQSIFIRLSDQCESFIKEFSLFEESLKEPVGQ